MIAPSSLGYSIPWEIQLQIPPLAGIYPSVFGDTFLRLLGGRAKALRICSQRRGRERWKPRSPRGVPPAASLRELRLSQSASKGFPRIRTVDGLGRDVASIFQQNVMPLVSTFSLLETPYFFVPALWESASRAVVRCMQYLGIFAIVLTLLPVPLVYLGDLPRHSCWGFRFLAKPILVPEGIRS